MTDLPFTIRRMTDVDAAMAARLDPLFDDGDMWDAVQGNRFLANPDNLLLVAFRGDTACGFLTAHRLQRFDARRAEVLLYEIGVDEAFRRRGIGAALIAGVNDWARKVGADETWVLTHAENAAAMALYARTGGEPDPDGPATMFTYRIRG